MRRYRHRVYHTENQAHVDAYVLQPLPGEPAVGEAAPHPADEALHYGPEPLVDDPLMLGALHVDQVPNREHVRRVLAALYPPPGDETLHLMTVKSVEDLVGLEAAVSGEELQLDVLSQQIV